MTYGHQAELKERVRRPTKGILSCDEERVFWISFAGDNTVGTIVVGHGKTNVIIQIWNTEDERVASI